MVVNLWLGLEIGDEGLNVCDCVFDFGVDRMIVFNVLIDLLKDLDFLSVGECVVVFARHGKSGVAESGYESVKLNVQKVDSA